MYVKIMLMHLNYKEMHKPSNEDLLWAKEVYDTIIVTQILSPAKVKEAFRKVFGYDAPNFQQAKIKLFAYFTYEYKKVDKTEIAEILPDMTAASTTGEYTHSEDTLPKNGESESLSLTNEGQSHSETVDFNDKPLTIFNADNETKEALKDLPLQPDEEAPAEITKPKRGRKSKKAKQ